MSKEYGFYGKVEDKGFAALVSESGATVKHVIAFADQSRGTSNLHHIELDDDDVLEVELDNVTLIMSVSELNALSLTPQSRGADDGQRMLPTSLRSEQDASRGPVGLAIRVLRVLGINVAAKAIEVAAKKVEGWLDDNGPGLYQVAKDGTLSKQSLPEDDREVLLLIHGTASATARAFASLLPSADSEEATFPGRLDRWNELYDKFEGRIYALEHRTLTESPITNLLMLLESWPIGGGPPLVLLSHSRGGIIGDYLSCLAEWEQQPPELISALDKKSLERKQLEKLGSTVSGLEAANRPKVTRHIRVGAPSAGTSLASSKTHIWLSVLSGLAAKLPGIGTAASALGDIAAAIVKEGLEPGTLPGIDAQNTQSPFILSAQFYRSSHTELFAITGNSHSILQKTLNLIFPGRHDLVVDTHSMLRGPEYKNRFELAIDDDDITHINYFRHRVTEAHLNQVLTGQESNVFKQVARPTGSRGRVAPATPSDDANLPCIVLLPGIMGSELSTEIDGESCDIWLNPFQLLIGRGKKLKIDNKSVSASGVLDKGYDDFVSHVRSSRRALLLPFGYDWRKSVTSSIEQLQELIGQRQSVAPDKPIILVCHSMGGLVARAWRQKYSDTWERIREKNGRMVQLGTPNYGSWTIPRIFRGEEKLLKYLAAADLKHSTSDWMNWISRFPGLLELSDFDNQHANLKQAETWLDLTKTRIAKADLNRAAKVREQLAEDNFESDDSILYVAGYSAETPGLIQDSEGQPTVKMQQHAGDGRVLWPDRDKNQVAVDYYMPTKHGDLLNSPEYFDAVIELALNGSTSGLSTRRPSRATSRGYTPGSSTSRSHHTVLEHEPLPPTSDELQAAALGGTVTYSPSTDTESQRLNLSITHGNLIFCDSPVMVGHYIGDSIRYAENTLDNFLEGTLTRRWSLGAEFYAGKVGTHEVALSGTKNNEGPKGAIVVGLGRMGELQKGDLVTTIRNGVLKYGQICKERGDDCSNLKIASLLIGSGQEALELPDVIDATIEGVMLANKLFDNTADSSNQIRITHIEFLEWQLDVAIRARHYLKQLEDDSDYHIAPGIRQVDGGRTRAYVEDNSEWWDAIRIELTEQSLANPECCLSSLTFSVMGGYALGQGASVDFVRREIDTALQPLLSNTNAPAEKAVMALFEQLIPARLKPFAAQRRNLVVNLDPESAYLPWEILVDRTSIGNEPMAVAAGFLRRIVPKPEDMPVDHIIHVEDDFAMIIGNPPAGNKFGKLPGAYEEAKSVGNLLLGQQWKVNTDHIYSDEQMRQNNTAAAIRQDIIASDHRILHIAAHGVHNDECVDRTGVVIGFDDNDEYELFSPHHVKSIRHKPSLVFINCCHTGTVDNWDAHKLSASLAAEFIKAGVHCVIGAGWAINDAAAKLFALEVYKCLLSGGSFGEAVKRARRAVYRNFNGTNTWAAFQCYGDAGYKLTKRRKSTSQAQSECFYHISEVEHELKNLRADLKGEKSSEVSKSSIIERALNIYNYALKQYDPDTSVSWGNKGSVLTLLALIFCEAGETDKADEFIELASNARTTDIAIQQVLELANFECRRAEARLEEARSANQRESASRTEREYKRQLDKVLDKLRQYADLHQHHETYEIAASGHKLLAMANRNERTRKSHLKKMTELYQKAAEQQQKNAFYPGTNALIGYVLLEEGKGGNKDSTTQMDKLEDIIERSLDANSKDDFWSIIAKTDASTAYALRKGNFANKSQGILHEIQKTLRRHPSEGQVDSVKKQYRFIAEVSTNKDVRDAAKTMVEKIC